MTRPSDIPQWAWEEAIKLNVGDDLTPAERATAEDVYFADLDRDARALLSAYERGRGEQRGTAETTKLAVHRDELLEAADRIIPYLEFTIGPESPGHHPTMRSAVAMFKATVESVRKASV